MLIKLRFLLERLLRKLPRHFIIAVSVVAVLCILDVTSIIDCR